jgi:hypothetical protein
MRLLAALLAWLRRLAGRRRARALLRERLPRGLAAAALRPTLRAPKEPAPGEYGTALLGAQVVRGASPHRLLRLAALPLPPKNLSAVLPDRLRLDGDLRVPAEREPPLTAAGFPPVPDRSPARPRTPLARAPISRVDPRAFRLDPRELTLANEGAIPLGSPRVEPLWLDPVLRRALLEPRPMASRRFWGMGPLGPEWFASWWAEHKAPRSGAGAPKARSVPADLAGRMDEVKEQMLIRRDVVKDESPPARAPYKPNEAPRSIAAHQAPKIEQLIPPKSWVETGPLPRPEPPAASLQSSQAYFEWRTLIDALSDG